MSTKLGQNFLNNKNIIKQIIESANLTADDVVLEIGPGKGILTEELAKKCKKVIAVEIDRNLVEILKNKFKGNERVGIVENNILDVDLVDLISNFQFLPPSRDPAKAVAISNKISNSKLENSKFKIKNFPYKLVANIPYYITSPIIRFFLESRFPPKEMILMIQKEVAERIVAKPGNHSILSLSVQYYADPEILFYVDKSNFDPAPEVDSAVIRVTRNVKRVAQEETDAFFRVARAGFCAKRKTLINNLSNSFHLNKKEVEDRLNAIGIKFNVRAQELDIEKWKEIATLSL